MEATDTTMPEIGRTAKPGSIDVPGGNDSNKEVTLHKIICNEERKEKNGEVNTCNMSKQLPKFLKINVNKPLIPLKIAIFCWFAGGSSLLPFVAIYLKQLGLTLSELSIIYIMLPFIQFLGTTVSGVVADKLGRSKPVLQVNLLLTIVAANSMLFIPGLKQHSCIGTLIDCNVLNTNSTSTTELCNVQVNESQVIGCTFHCPRDPLLHISDSCFQNYISECHFLSRAIILRNLTFFPYFLYNETARTCTKEDKVDIRSTNNSWCHNHVVNDCTSTCKQDTNAKKEESNCKPNQGKTLLFILSLIFLTTYNTFGSNAYRIFDVTAMSMIKTYGSDFGRQRVWAIAGSMIASPLAGYIISAISPQGGPQKYEVAFYIFDVMAFVVMFTVWRLDITIDPPANDMLKKAVKLLKNTDILAFIFVIFVNGTAWGFTRLFSAWYLEDLGAPSMLIGLAVALCCLIGLPFLFTSNWIVGKIGSSNMILLSLVGYSAFCIGYSFLINPWWALIYEIFGILTYHLLWVSVVTYSHHTAPTGLTATVIATAGGVHYGIGKGSGSLIGGVIMSKYGGRMAYRVMAAICAGTAVTYALYLYVTRKHRKK